MKPKTKTSKKQPKQQPKPTPNLTPICEAIRQHAAEIARAAFPDDRLPLAEANVNALARLVMAYRCAIASPVEHIAGDAATRKWLAQERSLLMKLIKHYAFQPDDSLREHALKQSIRLSTIDQEAYDFADDRRLVRRDHDAVVVLKTVERILTFKAPATGSRGPQQTILNAACVLYAMREVLIEAAVPPTDPARRDAEREHRLGDYSFAIARLLEATGDIPADLTAEQFKQRARDIAKAIRAASPLRP